MPKNYKNEITKFYSFVIYINFLGVLLAILEKTNVIQPLPTTNAGTVSAGYQNFLICIEMFFASIGLRSAFPYSIYEGCILDGQGRSVMMHSISSSLKVISKKFCVFSGLAVVA